MTGTMANRVRFGARRNAGKKTRFGARRNKQNMSWMLHEEMQKE